MKLKLLIALVALVPSLVMAQAGIPNVGSTGQPEGFQPLHAANPPGQVGANQQKSESNTGKVENSLPFNTGGNTPVGGKVDGHGSSNKATVKGSSQGSTGTYYCLGYICN